MDDRHRWTQLRLQAYYDGELEGRAADRVAAHLADCAACRDELDAMTSLSSLLQEAPPAPATVSDERFVAAVGLQLKRRPARPLPERMVAAGWRWAPAFFVAVWAFVQAVAWVTTAVVALLNAGIGTQLLERLPDASAGLVASLDGGWGYALLTLLDLDIWGVFATPGLSSVSLLLVQFALYLFLGLAIWSWLASWWAHQRHQQEEL